VRVLPWSAHDDGGLDGEAVGADGRHRRGRGRKAGMRRIIKRVSEGDAGLSTAEYAVGTVAVAGLGGVLIKLLTSPEVRDLLWSVLSQALNAFMG
jgi:hypothetical protein